MDIVIGATYIDPVARDVVKLTKIGKGKVFIKILADPKGEWGWVEEDWMSTKTFLRDYVPGGNLAEAIYN